MALIPQGRGWSTFGTKPKVGLGGATTNVNAARTISIANTGIIPTVPGGAGPVRSNDRAELSSVPTGVVPIAPMVATPAHEQTRGQIVAPGPIPLLPVTANPMRMAVTTGITLTSAEMNKAIMEANKKEAALPRLIVTKSIIGMYTREQKLAIAKDIRISSSELNGPGTINDSRMGVIGINMHCGYCGMIDCPSHYGLLKLPYPIYNPIGVRTLISVLQVVCNCCSRLLVPESVLESTKMISLRFDRRLAELEAYCKDGVHRCLREAIPGVPACQPNPGYDVTKDVIKKGVIRKIVPEDGKTTAKSRKEGTRVDCNIFEIIAILNNISEQDAKLMGFSQLSPGKVGRWDIAVSHPRDLIMTHILIPPPIIRPHIYEGGTFRNDILTTAYQSLIKKVGEIITSGVKIDSSNRQQMNNCQNSILSMSEYTSSAKVIESSKDLYAMLHGILMDASKAKFGHSSNKMITVLKRFDGKKGIGRMNAQGKRVNYSARTVLGPEISVLPDEIGIPEDFARVLTVPVRVTRYNTEYLTELLLKGKIQYITSAKTGLRQSYNNKRDQQQQLFIGDVVERWLQDGDWVMFNRQPSLHKQSMLAAKVRLRKMKTLGYPLYICAAQNADFDGDEGNLWPPQYIETMVECRFIYNMNLNLMSSERNCPMMGLTMNSITASYLLSAGNVRVPEALFREIIGNLSNHSDLDNLSDRLRRYRIHPRSGEALLSALFPKDFYYKHNGVLIIDGVLIKGQLKKSHVGTSGRSIVQDIHKRYGPMRTSVYICEATQLTCKWLIERGFTVGLEDIINPEESADGRLVVGNDNVVKKALASIYLQVEVLGGPVDDPIEERYRMQQRSNILNSAQGIGLSVAKEAFSKQGNNIGIMSDYGSSAKGGLGNVGQMMGCVSQQYYQGRPFDPSISGERRLLPNFDLDDHSPQANAFVESSLYDGSTPEEFFFRMKGGREGMLDTALTTPKTGSMHHLLGKGNENQVIAYDGSVRNTIGTLFTTSYGLGFDVSELLTVQYQDRKNVTYFMDVQQVCDTLNVEAGWVTEETYEQIQKQSVHMEDFDEQFLRQATVPEQQDIKQYPEVVYQTVAPELPLTLNKFETVRIIGSRANQIARDAVIRLPLEEFTPAQLADPVEVAYREFNAGKLQDLSSVRKYPNGDFFETVYYDGIQAHRGGNPYEQAQAPVPVVANPLVPIPTFAAPFTTPSFAAPSIGAF